MRHLIKICTALFANSAIFVPGVKALHNKNKLDTPLMTNGVIQYIKIEEPTRRKGFNVLLSVSLKQARSVRTK